MLEVRRAADRYRGGDAAAGIETRHAFSFSGFYDPDNIRFGLLVACNEERLAPGAGFDLHPHRDLEIVTWVVEGELEHQDSTGAATRIRPGDLQRLGAGSGVRHVERNAGPKPLRFVQMWLVPGTFGGPPEYEVVRGIADTPFAIPRTDAVLHLRRLAAGAGTAVPDAAWVYVHVVHGTVRLEGPPSGGPGTSGAPDGPGGARLGPGDAVRITDADGLAIRAETDGSGTGVGGGEGDGSAELLLWEMHAEPSYG